MGDLPRKGDLEVRIVDATTQDSAQVVTDEDSEKALKIKGNVYISGSSGASQFLSIANRIETASVTTSGAGWNTVLNLSVPANYTWFLKSMILGTSATAKWQLLVGGVVKLRGHMDADDSLPFSLDGYMVLESTTVVLQIDTGSANKIVEANLIIYEEANV